MKNIQINKAIERFIDSVIEIIVEQYTLNGRLYDYYGNDQHYDYNNNKLPPKIYFSGYDVDQLTDNNGEFYNFFCFVCVHFFWFQDEVWNETFSGEKISMVWKKRNGLALLALYNTQSDGSRVRR